MVVEVEVDSKNKELDTGGGEGGGVHVDDAVAAVVVVDVGEGWMVAYGDRLEGSRRKREKDSAIPSCFVPVKSTWVLE